MAVRTLIVDDQADMRMLLRAMVESGGYGVEVCGEAADAAGAVRTAAELKPDAILLDNRLPPTDGPAIAADLRSAAPDAVIVLCSAHVNDGLRKRAAAAGIEHCAGKDDLEGLVGLIADAAG